MIFKIDVTDWRDAAMSDETLPQNEGDIIKAVEDGLPTARIARDLLVAQEMGVCPQVTRPHKTLLNAAAAYDVSVIAKRRKVDIEVANGSVYRVPGFVGKFGRPPELPDDNEAAESAAQAEEQEEEQEYEPSFVRVRDERALVYIDRHLERRIPGDIWNKLLETHAAGGNVKERADLLKQKIDAYVRRITENEPVLEV